MGLGVLHICKYCRAGSIRVPNDQGNRAVPYRVTYIFVVTFIKLTIRSLLFKV
ncbi:hypothetical protein GQ53DRAFT_743510 [Thozetella sp. PMI_491]|nr:hypothetical protein GQ53DRAFT_743510 [Thozetella sp. PMI_491]